MCVSQGRQRKNRHKTRFWAWKKLHSEGNTLVSPCLQPYGPGVCVCKEEDRGAAMSADRYFSSDGEPTLWYRGLHVYRQRRFACTYGGAHGVVKVWIDPEDVIVCDDRQIAVRKLTILPEDWAAAGFQPQKPRRRVI